MDIVIQPAIIPSVTVVTRNKSLLDLIGPEYNYTSKKIDDYVSRNVSIPCIKQPKRDFSYSFNNCKDELSMPDETIQDKYKRLVICCNKSSESGEDEDIDTKIANLKAELESIHKLINKNIDRTYFMINFLDRTNSLSLLEESDMTLITESNDILKDFLEETLGETLEL
jgi:hypothetical protein